MNHNSRNLAIQMSGAILHGAQKDSADPKDDDLDDDESGKFVRDAVPAENNLVAPMASGKIYYISHAMANEQLS